MADQDQKPSLRKRSAIGWVSRGEVFQLINDDSVSIMTV